MHSRERPSASARDSLTSFVRPQSAPKLPLLPKPRSKAFSAVLHQVERFADDDTITIVFEGESGTGKNWLARLAHTQSRRAAHVFHEASLATITDSLAGSDLFGHEPGAFTDARSRRLGAFQSANHGTLFIDEVGKATETVQGYLLRAIEEHIVVPVGTDRSIKVDVRLILATNVDLKSLVAQELFLPDLYARLGHFRIRLPALRERPEDIPDLARYFLARHAQRRGYSDGLPTIHPTLMSALQGAEWEYNLRDLDNAMHRLLVEAEPSAELTFEHCVGTLEHLRVHSRGRPTKSSPARVAETVKRSRSIADAARSLSVARSTVYRKLAKIEGAKPPPVAD